MRDDTARRSPIRLRLRLASVPPLPPTLCAEGADQPFCLEMVANHAASGRVGRGAFMSGAGYTVVGRPFDVQGRAVYFDAFIGM